MKITDFKETFSITIEIQSGEDADGLVNIRDELVNDCFMCEENLEGIDWMVEEIRPIDSGVAIDLKGTRENMLNPLYNSTFRL